jgi:hypothetical protein
VKAGWVIVMAVAASAFVLAACTTSSSSQTTCSLVSPASAMATHGSLEVRVLRRDVVTIIRSGDGLETSPTRNNLTLPALGADMSLMATKLAALHYPPQYQATAQAMVTQTQSLAASLRSGQVAQDSDNALFAAVRAAQQFYTALGIPSVCTTTSGS